MNRTTLLERLAAARKFDSRADLRGVDLSRADLHGMDLESADLCHANLSEANLCEAKLYDADLKGANLRGANLYDADLSEASLYQADLRDADLRQAILNQADLRQARLEGANVDQAALKYAYLKDEQLPPNYYDEALYDQQGLLQRIEAARQADGHVDLRQADLKGADLHGMDLALANLSEANLREATLQRAVLKGAHLYAADLSSANLSQANLSEAYLCDANLRGANLHGANLEEANLRGADLYGANLSGAKLYNGKDSEFKEKLLKSLAKANGFSMNQLAANREGRFAISQYFKLSKGCFSSCAMSLLLSFLPAAFLAWLLIEDESGGCLILFMPFFASLIMWYFWRRRIQEQISGQVEMVTGIGYTKTVSRIEFNTYNEFPSYNNVIKHYYVIGREKFQVKSRAYNALFEGLRYNLYYMPRSRTILSIEPVGLEVPIERE